MFSLSHDVCGVGVEQSCDITITRGHRTCFDFQKFLKGPSTSFTSVSRHPVGLRLACNKGVRACMDLQRNCLALAATDLAPPAACVAANLQLH